MDQLDITLRQDKTDFTPREKVEGAIRWRLEASPRRIEVSLLWYTSGKGTRDVGVVETFTVDDPHSVGSRDFAFTLPEGPYTFSGKLISLVWAIEATCSPGDKSVRQQIVVSPARRPILLNGQGGSLKSEGLGDGESNGVFNRP
jgi:hypothetical protein